MVAPRGRMRRSPVSILWMKAPRRLPLRKAPSPAIISTISICMAGAGAICINGNGGGMQLKISKNKKGKAVERRRCHT